MSYNTQKENLDLSCPECNAKLNQRIQRKGWQRVLFPHSRRYECAGCGHLAFFISPKKHAGRVEPKIDRSKLNAA